MKRGMMSSDDKSSVLRLYHRGEAASLLNHDAPTSPALQPPPPAPSDLSWQDLVDFAQFSYLPNEPRTMQQIRTMNAILSASKLSFQQPSANSEWIENYRLLLSHYIRSQTVTFTWEGMDKTTTPLNEYLDSTLAAYIHPLDIVYIDHTLFTTLFPVPLLTHYLSTQSRPVGTPVYNISLNIQSNILAIYLHYHLSTDSKYLHRIDWEGMDAVTRIIIRYSNRMDTVIKDKYSDILALIYQLLDGYFPNYTGRYIAPGHEMHKWTLKIIDTALSLGILTVEEVKRLAKVLLEKIENLLVLETVCYRDFGTNAFSKPESIHRFKCYFYDCKELVVSICIHIVIMLNDAALESVLPLFTPTQGKSPPTPRAAAWSSAYMSSIDMSNIISRIFYTYILNFLEHPPREDRGRLCTQINILYALLVDKGKDAFHQSILNASENSAVQAHSVYSDGRTPTLRPRYGSVHAEILAMRKDMEKAIDNAVQPSTAHTSKTSSMTIGHALRAYMRSLSVYPCPPIAREDYLYISAHVNIPSLLLSMMTVIYGIDGYNEYTRIIIQCIGDSARESREWMGVIMGRQNRVHWEHILRVNRVIGMEVFSLVFAVDPGLLFAENELFGMIMDKGKEVLWERFSMSMKKETEKIKKINETFAPGDEAHKRNYRALFNIWFKEFKEKVLTDNTESEGLFEDLLMVYIFVRMMTNFARKRDANYEERFMSLTIQNIISPVFVDIFLEIILQKDFLVSASDDWPDVQEKNTNEKDNTQAEQIDGNRNTR